jgi:hypothetical protein
MSPVKFLGVIGGCVLLGVLSIGVLNLLKQTDRNYNGGFQRVFKADFLQKREILDIRYDSYYVSGIAGKRIYLGNTVAPSHILSVGNDLKDSVSLKLKIPRDGKIARRALHIMIDSTNIYAVERVTPSILFGSLTDLDMKPIALETSAFLGNPIVTPTKKVFVKTYDPEVHKSNLSKIALDPPSLNTFDILTKQVDGIFCTDGVLLYNVHREKLIYIYFYRNNFISLDTGVNVEYTAHTIDTVTRANFKVSEISSESTFTPSSPPTRVNKAGFAFRDWIFIHSALRSDNETEAVFQTNSVIDVYASGDGRYCFSFYLPDVKGHKLKHFAVTDDQVLAIHDHFLVAYPVRFPTVSCLEQQ